MGFERYEGQLHDSRDPREHELESEDGEEDFDDEEYFDCGIEYMKRGKSWVAVGCSLAGSEECDFECPNRNALYAHLKAESSRA